MKRLVLDFGGTNLKYGLVSDSGEIAGCGTVPAPKGSREEFDRVVAEIHADHARDTNGVAASFAGCVDARTGFVHHGGSYGFIMHRDLKGELEALLGCPVAIANDAECALLGERVFGNLRDVDNAAVLVLGTAIGGALMLDGRLYHGAHDNAGELSSYIYDVRDEGFTRYWFMHSSALGLVAPYAAAHGIDPGSYDARTFFEQLDDEKRARIDRFAADLARVIYSMQTVLDVERFLVGGGISEQPVLREAIERACARQFAELAMFRVVAPQVMGCAHGNDANLLGAFVHFDQVARGR